MAQGSGSVVGEAMSAHPDIDAEGHDYGEIERTDFVSFVLARDEAALAAKKRALVVPDDTKALELFAADVMPAFA